MRNRTYGGVRGRKTKVGRKLLRFPPTRFLGGGPWQERCLETKRILAYAEVLFRENDLSGTKWGAQRVLFRLKRFHGTKCLRLKVLFHVSVFLERNHRG